MHFAFHAFFVRYIEFERNAGRGELDIVSGTFVDGKLLSMVANSLKHMTAKIAMNHEFVSDF